jgi:DNA end-binding protein Ku
MQETGLSALARYAARGKQYLVLVRPLEDGLVMEQLHYADELRAFSEVPLGEGDVKPEELQLAVQIIKQAASESFEPQKYGDDVRQRMMEQIERKIAGEEITAAPAEEPQTQIIDLMDALKASLAKSGSDAEERKPAKRSSRAPAQKAKRKKAGGRG